MKNILIALSLFLIIGCASTTDQPKADAPKNSLETLGSALGQALKNLRF
jgi:hypothetical protein